jgi:subtilisin family serine protease
VRVALTLAALLCLAVAGGAAGRPGAGPLAGEYIVVLRDGVADVDAKVASIGASLGVRATHRYRHALKGFAASLTGEQASALDADPDVQFLDADRAARVFATVRIKPGEDVPDGLRRMESAVRDRIQKKSAWAVAVIDTGIDLDHPDLNARPGKDCTGPEPPDDDYGHGTHVAGTVAARNDGAGLLGVSPNTIVFAVKSFDENGRGTTATILCGIDWVAEQGPALGIRVANMSFGGSGHPDDGDCGNRSGDAEHKAICALAAAGVVPVAAAGNNYSDFADTGPATFGEVLTVTAMGDTDGVPGGRGKVCATTPDDHYAVFSNFAGNQSDAEHTVAGPGMCVRSSRNGGGPPIRFSGTSMAAPHVAGAVANCLGHPNVPGPCAGLSVAEIVQRIRSDAAAKPRRYGYTGDPEHDPPPGQYFGFLVTDLPY